MRHLVNDAQIAPDRYAEIITTAGLSTLGVPVTPPTGRKPSSTSRRWDAERNFLLTGVS